MVEIDNLSALGQGRVRWFVDRVVKARASMKEDQCRLFPHGWTVRHQLGSFDVEEQAYPVYENMHAPFSIRPAASALPCHRCRFPQWVQAVQKRFSSPKNYTQP